MSVLDALLDEGVVGRVGSTSRERWAKWEALNAAQRSVAADLNAKSVVAKHPDGEVTIDTPKGHVRLTTGGVRSSKGGQQGTGNRRVSAMKGILSQLGPGQKHSLVNGQGKQTGHVKYTGAAFEVKSPIDGRTTTHASAGGAAIKAVQHERQGLANERVAQQSRRANIDRAAALRTKGRKSKMRPSSLSHDLLRHDDGGPLDALLPVEEAADSMRKASTPEPFSTSKTSNWVARGGGLPAYIQHIAHDLMEKRGKSESNAIQMAIGIVKRWARGGGNVDANTRAAAAKAVAEWEKLKAGAHAKSAVAHSAHEELSVVDQIALAESAAARLSAMCDVLEADTVESLIEAAADDEKRDGLVEAEDASTRWAPELKRTAAARGESARHEVYDGGQHVGTVTERPGYGMNDTVKVRHGAYTINGREIRDLGLKSQQDAVEAVRKHLEEAPALVQPHRGGKFLVAEPRSYGGATTYTEYPNESAARHAAGLPEKSTAPERASQVQAMAECAAADYGLVTAFGGASSPGPLGEAFDTALHPHGYHGQFRRTGTVRSALAALTRRTNTSPRLPVRPTSRGADAGRFRGHALDEKGMVAQVGAHPSSKGWERHLADIERGMVKDSEHAHRDNLPGGRLGAYSPERAQLHGQIIRALLQGHKSHGNAQAHFTAGGPATGKSHMVKSGTVKLPADHAVINPDVVKEMLPEYQALKAKGDKRAATLTHEESSHVAKLATNIALGQKMHVVVDSVGNSDPGKFAGKIMNAHNAGHEVHVHYATTSVETALKREAPRAKRTGRKVNESFLRAAHTSVSQRFHEDVQHLPVRIHVYDTTSKRPKRIAAKTPTGPLRVLDSTRYAQFLSKGGVSGA